MSDPATRLAELIACESAVWHALVTGDAAADCRALAPDFLGVYPDGFSGREAHVAQLGSGPTVARFSLSQARLLDLGDDHALLAYRADYRRAGSKVDEAMYVSSIWRRERGQGRGPAGWVNVFSQDTPGYGRGVP